MEEVIPQLRTLGSLTAAVPEKGFTNAVFFPSVTFPYLV